MVGRRSVVGNDCFLDGRKKLTIGSDVNIGGHVHIYTMEHDVSAADSGFEVDTNRAILLDAAGGEEELPLLSKRALADVILDRVAALLANEEGQP